MPRSARKRRPMFFSAWWQLPVLTLVLFFVVVAGMVLLFEWLFVWGDWGPG